MRKRSPFNTNPMLLLTYPRTNLLALLVTLVVLGFSYYTELYQGQHPCALCIIQRIIYGILALLFLSDILARKKTTHKIHQCVILFIILLGIATAIRHIYLQQLPAGTLESCMPDFDFIIKNFPLTDAIKLVFSGQSDCTVVNWHLLGLTMPEWSLLSYCALMAISIVQLCRRFYTQSNLVFG